MFLKTALLVLRKDFAIEIKSYEILATTLFFAVGCVLVFAFALVKEGQAPPDSAAAILWIALLFAGTLALGRTFERERYGETIRALLLAPGASPGDLRRQAARHPVPARPDRGPARPVDRAVVRGAAAGAADAAAAAARLRHGRVRRRRHALRRDADAGPTRDVMLPILLYPITIPVIIAGVRGTSALLASPPDEPDGDHVAGDSAVLRRGVRDAVAVDVRAADDGEEL